MVMNVWEFPTFMLMKIIFMRKFDKIKQEKVTSFYTVRSAYVFKLYSHLKKLWISLVNELNQAFPDIYEYFTFE